MGVLLGARVQSDRAEKAVGSSVFQRNASARSFMRHVPCFPVNNDVSLVGNAGLNRAGKPLRDGRLFRTPRVARPFPEKRAREALLAAH